VSIPRSRGPGQAAVVVLDDENASARRASDTSDKKCCGAIGRPRRTRDLSIGSLALVSLALLVLTTDVVEEDENASPIDTGSQMGSGPQSIIQLHPELV
jgi:hypothetical protein